VDLYNGFNGLRHRINWTYFTVLDGLAHPLYSPILVILFFLWFIQTISGMTINTKRLTTFNPVSKVQKQFINSKE